MNIYHKIVQQKMRSLTVDELISYGKQYDFHLSQQEAHAIISLIREDVPNVLDAEKRAQWIRKLAVRTSPQLAKQVNELIRQFTQ